MCSGSLLLFVAAYVLYQLVRGLVGTAAAYKPFGDATRIIDLERALHVFVEPSIQAWARDAHWLMDIADWTYLNAHYFVTLGALVFIYLRRNDSFYFVRNMFMIAMAIALVGYALYPTAPPRLMPEWGFTDSISQFTGGPLHVDNGAGERVPQPLRGRPVDARLLRADDRLCRWRGWSRRASAKIAWRCTRCSSRSSSSRPATTTSPTSFLGALTAGVVGAARQAAARPRQARRLGVRPGDRRSRCAEPTRPSRRRAEHARRPRRAAPRGARARRPRS